MNAKLFMKINHASFAVKEKKLMQTFSNALFVTTRSNFMMSSNQSVNYIASFAKIACTIISFRSSLVNAFKISFVCVERNFLTSSLHNVSMSNNKNVFKDYVYLAL